MPIWCNCIGRCKVERKKKYIASCSWGKDSVAMIETLIDNNEPLDEIVVAHIEKTFPQEIEFGKKLIKRWEGMGYKCTVLKSEDTWDNWFFGEVTRGKFKGKKRGFPLTVFACWWSREAKFKVLDNYMKGHIRYIGIAADEPRRYKPEKEDLGYRYPLVDYQLTEADCRKLCQERGILNPLYKYFDRLGCYLCPKQKDDSLRNLCMYFPEQFAELKWYIEQTIKDDSFIKRGMFNTRVDYNRILMIESACKVDKFIEENQIRMF